MAQAAKGCSIKFGGAAGDAIGELRSVGGPAGTADVIDTSHHGLADKIRTFMGTLVNNGTVSGQCAMTAANITLVKTEFEAAATESIQISFPFSTPITLLFDAIVTSMSIEPAEEDGELLMNFELQVTGAITWGGLS